ncbi:MAG: SOS response-associated peptidase, partial [Acidobacteriota bacterium]
MCGRFTMTVSASVLAGLFDMDEPTGHRPRFNIAPTQVVPIVRSDGDGNREWAPCRWGLIPPWAKDLKIGARMINARSETAAEKPSFKRALADRRCLVPADGFYEWAKTADGKQPFHIRFSDHRPFAFGGIWERWQQGPGEAVDSFTILTTSPNPVAAPIHDRMPVILAPEFWEEWLAASPLSPVRRETLFTPSPPDEMEAIPVSKRVNSPSNDDPDCLEP